MTAHRSTKGGTKPSILWGITTTQPIGISTNQPVPWRLITPKEKPSINSAKTLNGEIAEYFGVTLFCWTVPEDSFNISMKWVGQEFSSPSKTILGKKFNLHCVFVCFYGRGTKQARYWKYWWIEVASLWTSLCERLMRCYRWQKYRWHAWGHLGRLDPYGTLCNQCSAIKYNPCPLISFKY